ncbi:helix-turn-helix domain-containing protein [Bacillus cereus]|uniref:helix-turn-helix domain-containing protein n=1 Tax=Bacillus thuringiensis TaxID=1428 RepID=UPI0018CDD166|nr:helix-turn-helix domain-containing protein [Bacillus thuringiensis]MEB9335642.1 helix-turn-helix domain-containing protein [Bacillus cereus]
MKFEEIPNHGKSSIYKKKYERWKVYSLNNIGFFPIFQTFKEEYLLKHLSGNAVKLYIYIGLRSGNKTGETWVTIDHMAKYFDKSPRTISNWLQELEDHKLIKRMQLQYNEPAHTFLQPYGYSSLLENPDNVFQNNKGLRQ